MATKVADSSIRSQLADGTAAITCVKCSSNVPLHGIHYVAEVCPNCLQNYRWGSGLDLSLYTAHGFWDAAGQKAIRANIARNGGRYVPEF